MTCLAKMEHSAALAQIDSRILLTTKFRAGAGEDPVVKVKALVTDLINKLQAGASSQASQQSNRDEEASKATEMQGDVEADFAKHSSKLEAAVARSTVPDGEISALH